MLFPGGVHFRKIALCFFARFAGQNKLLFFAAMLEDEVQVFGIVIREMNPGLHARDQSGILFEHDVHFMPIPGDDDDNSVTVVIDQLDQLCECFRAKVPKVNSP